MRLNFSLKRPSDFVKFHSIVTSFKPRPCQTLNFIEKMKVYQFLISLAVCGVAALAAPGTGAHFQSTPRTSCSGSDLVVSFDERGLGNEPITYTLNANIVATWGCVNNGGHLPKDAKKVTTSSSGGSNETLPPTSGRIQGSIKLSGEEFATPPSDFTCPSGLHLTLLSFEYDNIVFCDSTDNPPNGICFNLGSAKC